MNQKVEFETTKNPRLKTLAIEIITPPIVHLYINSYKNRLLQRKRL